MKYTCAACTITSDLPKGYKAKEDRSALDFNRGAEERMQKQHAAVKKQRAKQLKKTLLERPNRDIYNEYYNEYAYFHQGKKNLWGELVYKDFEHYMLKKYGIVYEQNFQPESSLSAMISGLFEERERPLDCFINPYTHYIECPACHSRKYISINT